MSDNLGATEKELVRVRTEKLEKIEKMGFPPYPNTAEKDYSSKRILEISSELIASGQTIHFAGRIIASRGHGKLSFLDLADEQGKIQVVLKEGSIKSGAELIPLLDIADLSRSPEKYL
ncbi:MAG: Lysine--tRNA ligase [bacterium ADurb.BinA186]|nr:MAG: Lysine--tRNA ligase [bacterium ADurb.BinA186]